MRIEDTILRNIKSPPNKLLKTLMVYIIAIVIVVVISDVTLADTQTTENNTEPTKATEGEEVTAKKTFFVPEYELWAPYFPKIDKEAITIAVIPFKASALIGSAGSAADEVREELEFRLTQRINHLKSLNREELREEFVAFTKRDDVCTPDDLFDNWYDATKSDRYNIMSMERISAILRKNNILQATVNIETIQKNADLLGVDSVITGQVKRITDAETSFILKAIRPDSGDVIYSERFSGDYDTAFDTAVNYFYFNLKISEKKSCVREGAVAELLESQAKKKAKEKAQEKVGDELKDYAKKTLKKKSASKARQASAQEPEKAQRQNKLQQKSEKASKTQKRDDDAMSERESEDRPKERKKGNSDKERRERERSERQRKWTEEHGDNSSAGKGGGALFIGVIGGGENYTGVGGDSSGGSYLDENGAMFGGAARFFGSTLGIGANVFYTTHDYSATDTDYSTMGGTVDLLMRYNTDDIVPYLFASYGQLKVEVKSGGTTLDNDFTVYGGGAGIFTIPAGCSFSSFGAELKYLVSADSDDMDGAIIHGYLMYGVAF